MHCFVGKRRTQVISQELGFSGGKSLHEYHSDLALQIKAVDYVLFDFEPTCEIYEEHGHKRLKIDVKFRHLKPHSRVVLTLFGRKGGQSGWTKLGTNPDWPRQPSQDHRKDLRPEGPVRLFEGVPTMGYDEMKIAVQIDVLGDGSYLYPDRTKEYPKDPPKASPPGSQGSGDGS